MSAVCTSCSSEILEGRGPKAKYCSAACARREITRRREARLSKARKLAIAAAVAPSLRAIRKPRLITTVDADGKPVRTITHVQLADAILKRAGIELSTDHIGGAMTCERCKAVCVRRATNAKHCDACAEGRCVDCNVPLSTHSASRCRPCAAKHKTRPVPHCPTCAAELRWTKNGTSRCYVCRPRAMTLPCVACDGHISGFARKGKCFSCYLRSKHPACVDCKTSEAKLSTKGLCSGCGKARHARQVEIDRTKKVVRVSA